MAGADTGRGGFARPGAGPHGGAFALPPVALAPLALGLVVLFQLAIGMLAYPASGAIIWPSCCGPPRSRSAAAPPLPIRHGQAVRRACRLRAGRRVLSALAGLAQYAGWRALQSAPWSFR